jgi:hypothetical protein
MRAGRSREGFREIRAQEAALLERLLAREFPGSAELREQLRTISVAEIDADGSLRLSTRASIRAAVRRRIPVEASYVDRDGVRVHLLLHVVDGYLDELEVLREDPAPVMNRPVDQAELDFDQA